MVAFAAHYMACLSPTTSRCSTGGPRRHNLCHHTQLPTLLSIYRRHRVPAYSAHHQLCLNSPMPHQHSSWLFSSCLFKGITPGHFQSRCLGNSTKAGAVSGLPTYFVEGGLASARGSISGSSHFFNAGPAVADFH